MKQFNKNPIATILGFFFVFVVLGLSGPIVARAAATSPDLGSAATYSALAGTQVTNSGATTISGNVGIWPGSGGPGTTGFGTVTLGAGSAVHDADAAAHTAKDYKNTAFSTLDQGCDVTYVGVTKELAGQTLVPGVYCADKFDLSSGTLTLSGNATDVWIFKSASSLVVSGGSSAKVVFTGGGLACNVWWRVVSSATLDANSSLAGNVLAGVSVTLANGASLNGRALAGTETVTLVGNSISGPTCAAAPILTLEKKINNDNGGTRALSDFTLTAAGPITIKAARPASFMSGAWLVIRLRM